MSTVEERLQDSKICLLFTPEICQTDPWTILEELIQAGLSMVQIRSKQATSKELLALALRIVEQVAGRALVIVNDRADIAVLAKADGVHLGQDDMSVPEARKILGEEKLLGISTHNLQQLQRARQQAANYLGFGPIFPSQTKGYTQGLGKQAWAEICSQLQAAKLPPTFLIGGITAKNITGIARVERIAVSSSILWAKNPVDEFLALKQYLLYNPPHDCGP